MKEGFTFKWASLKFLRKIILKNFGGGRGQKRAFEFYLDRKPIESC